MEQFVPTLGFLAAAFVWELTVAVVDTGFVTFWKLVVAMVIAAMVLLVPSVLRSDRMQRAAWAWAGYAPDNGRIPPPRDILDGCEGRIRTLVFRGALLADRMRRFGFSEESRIFDNTEKVFSLFFRSVLDGEGVETATNAVKKQAEVAIQAARVRRCPPALKKALREWGGEVDEWVQVVNFVGRQAADDIRKGRVK
ncbi:hypothetical protein HY971_01815 [Candidatus Kaiserbacteria bacterium]|nr:hypothetical protein [Candidatus Kaiserbacteria bacterium]